MRILARISWSAAIAAVAVLAGGITAAVALASSASATARHASPASCRLATLKGLYLFDDSGWTVSHGRATPDTFAGSERYDGAGHVHGIQTFSINGVITRNISYTGTYTVAANCTGTLAVGTGFHADLFIAPGGNRFTYTETDPGTALSSSEQRAG